MVGRIARGLLFVGFVNAAYLACGGSEEGGGGAAGSGGASTGGSAGADAGAGWAVSACGVCVESTCATEVTQCEAEPSCANFIGCLEACPVGANGDADPTCEAACPVPTEGAGQTAVQSFLTCRAQSNCAPCGGGNSDAGSKHPILSQQCSPATTLGCAKCEDENCCDTYAACAGDADCQAIKNCLKACTDPVSQCFADCFAANPGGNGKQLTLDRFACIDVLCAVPCSEITLPCDFCFREKCANTLAACDVDESCYLGTLCISECGGNQTCVQGCVAQVPGPSVDILNAFLNCSINECDAECSG